MCSRAGMLDRRICRGARRFWDEHRDERLGQGPQCEPGRKTVAPGPIPRAQRGAQISNTTQVTGHKAGSVYVIGHIFS